MSNLFTIIPQPSDDPNAVFVHPDWLSGTNICLGKFIYPMKPHPNVDRDEIALHSIHCDELKVSSQDKMPGCFVSSYHIKPIHVLEVSCDWGLDIEQYVKRECIDRVICQGQTIPFEIDDWDHSYKEAKITSIFSLAASDGPGMVYCGRIGSDTKIIVT